MKAQVQILRDAFGRYSIAIENTRVAGEKLAGGAVVVETFAVEVERIEDALRTARKRERKTEAQILSPEQLAKLRVGSVVLAGVLPCYERPFRRTQSGWRPIKDDGRLDMSICFTTKQLAAKRPRRRERDDVP